MIRFSAWRTVAVMAAAIAIFVFFFTVAVGRLLAIEPDVTRDFGENLVLSMAQNEKTVLTFLDTLHRYSTGEGSVDKEQLAEKFDLVWSRVAVVDAGNLAERLRAAPAAAETMTTLNAALGVADPLVAALEPGDRAGARQIENLLVPLLPELGRATFAASHADLNRLSAQTETRQHAIFTVIGTMLGILFSVAILIGILLVELRSHRVLARLAQAAEHDARASEQRALDSERLLRTIIDAVPAIINVKDTQSRYVWMNAYQGKAYGVRPEDAVGHTSEEFTGATYGGISRSLDLEVMTSGMAQSFHERAFVDRDGREITWWTAKAPLLGADGAPRYVVTVALDISRLKRVEAARRNLSRYFSPNVVEMLAARDSAGAEEAHRAEVAVLFADLHDFTRLAARTKAEEVLVLLRDLLRRLTDAVLRHDGTLEKYLGDGLMATFGTPVSTGRDGANAVLAGLEMLDVIEELNAARRQAGEEPLRLGVGIHYGPVLLGDIGSAQRAEYAVIGDTVNLASRLQGLTRRLGCDIVVSEDLADAVAAEGGATILPAFQANFSPRREFIDGYENAVAVRTLKRSADKEPLALDCVA